MEQLEPAQSDPHKWWMKWVPVVSLFVGITALTFQITVLYPWHLEISEQIAALGRAIRRR